jgi:hypothetical protein
MTLDTLSRRQFLGGSAKVGALAASVLASGVSVQALAAPLSSPEQTDLLFALGQRIAQDALHALNSDQVGLVYHDHASHQLEPLRQGMEQVLSREAGRTVQAVRVPAAYGAIVGSAIFTDVSSGAHVQIEVFAAALSQLEMIRSVTASGALQKHAVMAASADAFYSMA